MNVIFTAILLPSLVFAQGPVGPVASSETKPLPCGDSTSNSDNCQFKGDFCSFVENFDGPFRATDFQIYDGNPTNHEFVVESGKPVIKNGMLTMPLTQTATPGRALAAIVSTTRFLNYGSFEARLKTIGQSSVVTTLIGISNVLDEIDFEWVPKNAAQSTQVQANWYYNGEAVFDVNFQDFNTPKPTYDEFYTYRVDWTPEKIDWSVDGQVFYTQTKAELGVNGTRFPATPMRISFGVWQAEDNEWAGPNSVDFNAGQNLEVQIDYLKIFGQDCGGGILGSDPPLSTGFVNRKADSNWTPATSSVQGNGQVISISLIIHRGVEMHSEMVKGTHPLPLTHHCRS
jgi:beta-glucanase (GH16 family)